MSKSTTKTTTATSTNPLDRFTDERTAQAHVTALWQEHERLAPLANQYRQLLDAHERADALAAEIREIQAVMPEIKARDYQTLVDSLKIIDIKDADNSGELLAAINVTYEFGHDHATGKPHTRTEQLHAAGSHLHEAVAQQVAHLLPARVIEFGDGDAAAGIAAYLKHKRRGYVAGPAPAVYGA